MLGTLLRMSGEITRDEFEDLVLRFVIVEHDEEHDDEDPDDRRAAGNALLMAHALTYRWRETEDILASKGGDGKYDSGAYGVIRRAYMQTYVVRMKRAGNNVDQEYAEEAFPHELPGADIETIQMVTRSMAVKIGTVLGENDASQTLAMWNYIAKQDKTNPDWWRDK